MNPSDRITILVAIILMVASLGAGAMLAPAIVNERTDLQLTASAGVMDDLPPDVAMLYMGLGSFRGLFVDILWGRLEQMKQDGKFWEAAQLAEWVTKLQPRFPQVWAYHAWNLAYNVSVATHTADERWQWVNDGVRILRDQGIPMNPESVLLYKELGWIFLHKIGQFSDDMHWHYKERLAREWQQVLGPPREGFVAKLDREGKPVLDDKGEPVKEYAAVADMRRIAAAHERYLNRNELDRHIRAELDRLATDSIMAPYVEPLTRHRFERFRVKLDRLKAKLDSDEPAAGKKLAKLVELTAEHERVMSRDPLARLRADSPAVVAELEKLGAIGYEADEAFVIDVGKALGRADSFAFRLLGPEAFNKPGQTLSEREKALGDWLSDQKAAAARDELLAFARAKLLRDRYHMDPMWMLELMEGGWFVQNVERERIESAGGVPSIPIDWRHPAAHGLYWASMGVRVSHGLIRPGNYDVLNTDRQVLHALQSLTHTGKIVFDPQAPADQAYRQLPDPRFIDAYDLAVYGAKWRIFSETLERSAAPESFQSGHENFLIWSTQTAYFWGDLDKAREYYGRLRKEYSGFQAGRAELYAKPLEEFVLFEFKKEDQSTSLDDARSAIAGRVSMAITMGLVNGRGDVARRQLADAARLHALYQAKQNYKTDSEGRNRMGLPPFDDIVGVVFTQFLTLAPEQIPTLVKARAWDAAPNSMKLLVYDRVSPQLGALCRTHEPPLTIANAFPEPSGLDMYRKSQQDRAKELEKAPGLEGARRVK